MKKVCIIKENIDSYPRKEELFRAASAYPESPFKKDIAQEENLVYKMVREGFRLMGLDEENFGSDTWNPLGEIIKPGDCVLLKPNMVLHENGNGCGTDCLFTHPSLVAAIIDYTVIALKGKGKIVVGDAPLQECEFETLVEESGYRSLIQYYQEKGLDISLVDFRNVKTYAKNGVHYLQSEEREDGVVIKLNENSVFSGIGKEQIQNLRITNYDPRILQEHHQRNVHEYRVSQYVLDADVIINIPKPKTHRKAGVTISLKNLVGINTNKEFLPHHTLGSKKEGGDAYLHENHLLKLANEILDIKNQLVHDKEVELAQKAEDLYHAIYKRGKKQSQEDYWEGSWYGNDTIWRTIIDLNRILFYADKHGNMSEHKQRKMFIVGDMIVSGEKEGPLEPSPIYPGLIVFGDDPLKFDRVVCSVMGFDYHDIPTLYNNELAGGSYPISDEIDTEVISNDERWNQKDLDEIRRLYSFNFQPTLGWSTKLGNRYRAQLYKALLKEGKPVYVFGAGKNGIYAMEELNKQHIEVKAFLDNNEDLWGKEIYNGVCCVSPEEMENGYWIVIAVCERYTKEIKKQMEDLGGRVIGILNIT